MRKRSRRVALERRAAKRLPKAVRCLTGGMLAGLPAYSLIGRIPTAAYPDNVQTTPQGKLVWIAGKGFGSGPNPSYYFGGAKTPFQTPAQRVRHLRARHADRPRRHARSPPTSRSSPTRARPMPRPSRPTRRPSRPAARSRRSPVSPAARSSTSSTSCGRTAPTTRSSAPIRAATGSPASSCSTTTASAARPAASRPTRTRCRGGSPCWTTSTRTPRCRSTAT